MFHVKDNVFFGVCKDGSVRIVQLDAIPCGMWPDPDEPKVYPGLDISIDWDSWESIVKMMKDTKEDTTNKKEEV